MIQARNVVRRLGRSFSLTATAAALLAAAPATLLALTPPAQAQGLFAFFSGGPSPYDIERRLDASGYVLTGPLIRRGDVYLADVVIMGRREPQRLVIDAETGRIVERYSAQPARWRDAPRDLDPDDDDWGPGPRPPENLSRPIRRDQVARDEDPAFGTGAPRTTWEPIEQPEKAKPKPHEAKRKSAPLAKTSAPPSQSEAPAGQAATVPLVAPPTRQTAAPAPTARTAKVEPPPVKAAEPSPARTEPTPKTEPPPSLVKPSPVASSPAAAPAAVTAKTDEPMAAPKSPPRATETPDHKASSKSKAVNDIPVTPLD
jgi:hypothetical protein